MQHSSCSSAPTRSGSPVGSGGRLQGAQRRLWICGADLPAQLTLLGLCLRANEESASLPVGHDLESDRAAAWTSRVKRQRAAQVFSWRDQRRVSPRRDYFQQSARQGRPLDHRFV